MAAFHSVFRGSILSQHHDTWHLLPGSGKKQSGSTVEPTQKIQLFSCRWALLSHLHITPHLCCVTIRIGLNPRTEISRPSPGHWHSSAHRIKAILALTSLPKRKDQTCQIILLWHHYSHRSSLGLSQVNKPWKTREWPNVKLSYLFQAPFGL